MRKMLGLLMMTGMMLGLSACSSDCDGLFSCSSDSADIAYINQADPQRAPYLNAQTMYKIDHHPKYDAYGAVIPLEEREKLRVAEKWRSSQVKTDWHQYHGHLIRVDMLQSNRDLREMRLRFFHSSHDGYINGGIGHSLDQVAQYVIRQSCGRNASDALIVYDRPSSEVQRPSPFYDFETVAKGVSVREYGFRCIYPDDEERGWLKSEAGCR